jgi:hypothetical protein
MVGLLAGLTSIVGAGYSAVQYLRPSSDTGEMVAVVREARSDSPIRDATVEILNPHNTLVTTVVAAEDGSARQPLKSGPYRVRVNHPGYAVEARDIEVQPGQVAEIRFALAQRTERRASSPLDGVARGVERGANAAGRFLRNLGR